MDELVTHRVRNVIKLHALMGERLILPSNA
jgi:hypothetical protein